MEDYNDDYADDNITQKQKRYYIAWSE